MSTYDSIVEQIDQQITHLKQVRSLLETRGDSPAQAHAKRRGRPPKAVQQAEVTRQLSDEARARIAAAQKKRWVGRRKAAAE